MNYSDIPFDTGDLILFHGATIGCNPFTNFLSFAIERCTRSKFSHSGIVIKDPEFTPEPLQGLYLLESTGLEDIPDVEDSIAKFGVQLRKLDEVIRNYDGKVFWRKLECKRDDNFYDLLAKAHSVVHNRPYDDGVNYLKALFHWRHGDIQEETTFFCSALCAFIYVALEKLPQDTPWSIVTPHDLSTESKRSSIRWVFCSTLSSRCGQEEKGM